MTTRWRDILIGLVIAAALTVLIGGMVLSRANSQRLSDDAAPFFRELDLGPFDRAAVHSEGRVKSFDSFAREIIGLISGSSRIAGLPPDMLYLDLMFRPERYAEAPIYFVKVKTMRAQIAAALRNAGVIDDQWGDAFVRTGLISLPLLDRPEVADLVRVWSNDVVRTAKHVDALRTAVALADQGELTRQLRMIPPPSGGVDAPWVALDAVWAPMPTLMAPASAADGIDPALRAAISTQMGTLASAWRAQDAAKANAAIAELASSFRRISPEIYPEPSRMWLETWYHKSRHLVWGWLIYLVAAVLLFMSAAYRWDRAHAIGMGVFIGALALHTVALGWRWHVSGRWPNSNMFEAVTTSVWFGAVLALGLDILARKTPFRGLFALTGAAAAMAALMAAHYWPDYLNPGINNMMPILHDLWLYIHTNVIIASYALIAMAAVTATIYLLRRIMGGSADYAQAGGAATLLRAADGGGTVEKQSASLGTVLDGATMVLMEMAFVLLWAGLFMGAIWADHSWGRPWGWDPKEVFALNTFLVFLVLIHIRLKVRDKGLWTAVLAIIGCAVMLFNWIVINFVISGLHSYA